MEDKSRVSRPKVRFSQSAESPQSSDSACPLSKPRIRSVVNLKGPNVKILKPASSNFDRGCEDEDSSPKLSAGDHHRHSYPLDSESAHNLPSCLPQVAFSSERLGSIAQDASEASETTKNKLQPEICKTSQAEINVSKKFPLSEKALSIGSKKSASTASLKVSAKPARITQTNLKSLSLTNLSREETRRGEECKENIPAAVRNSCNKKSNLESKTSMQKVAVKKTEAPGKSKGATAKTKSVPISTQSVRKSTATTKSALCPKAIKSRSKSIPVKKTILRDISSSNTRAYVGPGVIRPRSLEPEIPVRECAPRSRSEILSCHKLTKPEYNSIVGTVRKLQELREERVIKDVEQLPAVYRGLVNGKVSSALDFGANEAIYHDLVDLSIDEKLLPSRLTRSKDPEPRQKDLVPKLSDFFLPVNDEEYRKAVLARPPSPRVLDTWNPYKISDRIFAWKESLDHDL